MSVPVIAATWSNASRRSNDYVGLLEYTGSMTRLLVTGGAGFIGSSFVRMAVKKGYEVVVLDKLTYAGNLENLRDLLGTEAIEFVPGDICNPEQVRRTVRGCDAIVHMAAETHVDRSILEAGAFVQTDVYGTHVMLEAARKENVDRFLHVSTDEVYGESGARPSREDAPLMPKSPYAASKTGADRLVYAYVATYGFPAVITRCVNNYGPFQHPEKAMPLFAICALVGHPLPVYGRGANRREWIHVEDHGAALLGLLAKKGAEGETFNIGTGERLSTVDVARAVLDALGKPRRLIEFVQDRPGHVLRHAVDSTKIRKAIGWRPRHSAKKGIPDTVAWYARNVSWWRTTVLGPARGYFEDRYPRFVGAVERYES